MTAREPYEAEPLLTPSEVAALWRVDVKTVQRWRKAGRFPAGTVVPTPGGHFRYKTSVILAMRDGRRP